MSQRIVRAGAILLIAWSVYGASACGPAPTPEVRLGADASRQLTYGELGPWGVGLFERTFRVRVDSPARALITAPLDEGGQLASGPFPLVIFVHGGLVPPERYLWWMEHVSSRGFVVVAPGHVADLAFFAQGNALDVARQARLASARPGDPLEGLIRPGPGLIAGHSLGGVVAASAWLDDPEALSHLVLIASEPNPSDDFTGRPRRPGGPRVLSVTGSTDKRQTPAKAAAGAEALKASGSPVTLAIIQEINHYQWTSDYTPEELKTDGPVTLPDQEARRRGMILIDMMLESLVRGDEPSALDEAASWGPDVLTYEAHCAQGGVSC